MPYPCRVYFYLACFSVVMLQHANSGINFAFLQVEDGQLRCFHESFELPKFISEISFSFHDSKEHNIMITSFKTAMQKGKVLIPKSKQKQTYITRILVTLRNKTD
ncbi:hypothetical protein ERO13_D13G190933v2 [Gossypium hirsutum]|nr:hypothetical protein ERO13_D13G190933v2 [Gossypium hirsutum]